jgi:preprotein translocase subunit SecF
MMDFLLLFAAIVIPFVGLVVFFSVLVFMFSWIRKRFSNRGRSSVQSQQINHKHQHEVDRKLEEMKIKQNEVLRQGQNNNRRF